MRGCPPRLACFAVPKCILYFGGLANYPSPLTCPDALKANPSIIEGMLPDSFSLPCALAFFSVIQVALHCLLAWRSADMHITFGL